MANQYVLVFPPSIACHATYINKKTLIENLARELHPAGKINQYMPPRVCVTPPSFA